MTERSQATPPLEFTPVIPAQLRRGEHTTSPTILTDIHQVVDAAMRDIVVVGNRTVYALLGDCRNENMGEHRDKNMQDRIREIKGEARGNRPLGLTIPYEAKELEGAFKTSRITDEKLRTLMEDPDLLTLYVGALCWVRGVADLDAIKLPDYVISKSGEKSADDDSEEPELQVYSPKGNETACKIIEPMVEQNGLAVMSSANESGDPSITTTGKALDFAREHKLPICIDLPDSKRTEEGQGSYAAIRIRKRKLHVIRAGFLGADILSALFDGLPVADNIPENKNSPHILRLAHLVEKQPRAAYAKGPEMRKRVLEYLGIG